MKDLFSTSEIAKILRVSVPTANRWLNSGKLKGFRPSNNANWKVTRKELVKYMKEHDIPMEFLVGDKIKILIANGDVNITRTIRRALQGVDQFQLEIAHSCFSAGTKLESFKPDVVVLDICILDKCIVDIGCREFFQHIRNHPEINGTKVIGISGKLKKSEIKSLLEQGFDDILQKPFKMEKLKETIITMIE